MRRVLRSLATQDTLQPGSLLTFMSTHFFQFRFAETEQYWLFTLTFFRTCERLARARNSDTISTSPSYPAVTLSTQCLARQWIHVLLISPVFLSNCPHFLRVGGLGHELDCTQKSGHISLSSAGSLVSNADGNRFANALGRRSRATGETNCKYVVDVSIPTSHRAAPALCRAQDLKPDRILQRTVEQVSRCSRAAYDRTGCRSAEDSFSRQNAAADPRTDLRHNSSAGCGGTRRGLHSGGEVIFQ